MPTLSQLYSVWEAQLEFFGGSGLPKQNYEGSSEGYGLTTEKYVDSPLVSRNPLTGFSGRNLGEITLDPDTRELKITFAGDDDEFDNS